MNTFLSRNESKLKTLITDVKQYDENLKKLSDWWAKIALIGKINSLDVAATILDDMDSTRVRFHQLQEQLSASLTKQYTQSALVHHQARCQTAIDILIRNLFERTADIGFLSGDNDIAHFMSTDSPSDHDQVHIQQRLQHYVSTYSVYNDAILISNAGQILFQLSQPERSDTIKHEALQQSLSNPNTHVEFYGQSPMINDGKDHLLYLQSVQHEGKKLGVVVLCFNFENEMHTIFSKLNDDRRVPYFLVDEKGNVLNKRAITENSVPSHLTHTQNLSIVKFHQSDAVLLSTQGNAYQNYRGPKGWTACALMPFECLSSLGQDVSLELENTPETNDIKGLLSQDLLTIRDSSREVNGDLELIVLNGIITAARKESAEFMPVLNAIKNIGHDIDTVFAHSIESLTVMVLAAQLDEIRLHAELAVDILDRNLYERANDCRWWALDPRISDALQQKPINTRTITEILKTTHQLYTVYHDIYVFDAQRHYVASSLDNQPWQGKKVEEKAAADNVFALKEASEYAVSPFISSERYDGKMTYIYNGAIHDENHSGRVIGGIGTVFDAQVEFKAILLDVLTKGNPNAFALFTDGHGKVLSSTSEHYAINDVFLPKIDLSELHKSGSLSTFYLYQGKYYLLGAALSQGYREFKNADGYQEQAISWILLPC